MSKATLRTFIAYVEDLPGVLNRITSLFRRRNYNIVSLTVGRTERAGVSRMTIVLEADDDAARRIEANLYKLVNVLFVEDTSHAATMVRELALIKVRADADEPRRGDAPLRGLPRARRRRRARGARRRDHRRAATRSTAWSTCCVPSASSRWCAPAPSRWSAARRRPTGGSHPAQRSAASAHDADRRRRRAT